MNDVEPDPEKTASETDGAAARSAVAPPAPAPAPATKSPAPGLPKKCEADISVASSPCLLDSDEEFNPDYLPDFSRINKPTSTP